MIENDLSEALAYLDSLPDRARPTTRRPSAARATTTAITRARRRRCSPGCLEASRRPTTTKRSTYPYRALPRRKQLMSSRSVKLPIFMDNHSTTPVDPRVARDDAAVLHAALRQRREPQPRVRLDGRGRGRERARPGRGADRRRRQGDRVDVAARPRRTTSRSRAPRASTRSRATTSSPSRPSTRACSTPASASSARATRSRTSRRRRTASSRPRW